MSRPKLPPTTRRRVRNICLSPRVDDYLRSRSEAASRLIETALLQTYDIPTLEPVINEEDTTNG